MLVSHGRKWRIIETGSVELLSLQGGDSNTKTGFVGVVLGYRAGVGGDHSGFEDQADAASCDAC